MNSKYAASSVLNELNEKAVKDLIPLFVVLSLLMLFGLLENASMLLFIWSEAKQLVGTFFLRILAIVDTLVCLTISLNIIELNNIYKVTNDALCKITVFSKFSTSLFSGFILVTIAVYRHRLVCFPFKRQLDVKGAKLVTVLVLCFALLLSVPQVFLVETVGVEIPTNNNLTLFGSDCVVNIKDNTNLKIFHTFIEGTYIVCFIASFTAMFVLYYLLGKAIYNLNRTHAQLTQATELTCISKSEELSPPAEENLQNDRIFVTEMRNPVFLPSQRNEPEPQEARKTVADRKKDQKRTEIVSSTKLSVMYFIIALGFILSFTPYLAYSIWRQFFASRAEIAFSSTPLNLFCLNSYLINSITNPIVYGFFNSKFRKYLKGRLPCRLVKLIFCTKSL